ncbi:hypothetical protein A2U01_0070567, partial [Trifolium medium]|nr:hypothetical protein [Trifolium medium]
MGSWCYRAAPILILLLSRLTTFLVKMKFRWSLSPWKA